MKYVPNNTALAVANTTIHLALWSQGRKPVLTRRRIAAPDDFQTLLRDGLSVGMESHPLFMAYSVCRSDAHAEMRNRMWDMAALADEEDSVRACYLGLWLALHDPVIANANCIRRVMRDHLITYHQVFITTARSEKNAHVVWASHSLPDRSTIRNALMSADQLLEPGILFDPQPIVPRSAPDTMKTA